MHTLSLETINRKAPYRVEARDRGNTYLFTTDFSVDIAVGFDDDDLLRSGESYQFSITNVNKKSSPRDLKVRDTISAIIDDFFTRNQAALLYICETGDHKQAMRNRLFASWFAAADNRDLYTILTASVEDEDGEDNFTAIILRKDNPNFVEFVAEFTKAVSMFSCKPGQQDQ